MILSLDVETSMAPNHFPWARGSYLSIVCGVEDTGKTHTWVINHNSGSLRPFKIIVDEIQTVIDRADLLVGHNIKFDLHWLKSIGLETRHVHDTMVCEYLIVGQDNTKRVSLDETAKRYGLEPKIDIVKQYWKSGVNTASVPLETLVEYCLRDTELALEIYHKQLPIIQELGLSKLAKLHNYFVECLQEIESTGIKVDLEFLATSKVEYKERMDRLRIEMQMFLEEQFGTDFEFNLSSNDHLSVILYGGNLPVQYKETYEQTLKSGVVKIKERWATTNLHCEGLGFKANPKEKCKKEGYYKTNKAVLASLAARSKAQKYFVEAIGDLSRTEKIYSTYLEGMEKFITEEGLIHPNFNQAFTVTGRLSSSQPNFQNLPRGGTDTVAKRLFVASAPDRMIVNGDLSALEWCVGAQLSGDKVMIEEIENDVDIHTANSIAIFGSGSFRQESKTISFRSLN